MRWTWRRPTRYERLVASADDQYRLAEAKRAWLALLGRHALEDARNLTGREADLVHEPPLSAERYQYLVDAVTRALGEVITDLARRWAEQG